MSELTLNHRIRRKIIPFLELMSLQSGQALLRRRQIGRRSQSLLRRSAGLPRYAIATVFVNRIPSAGQIVDVPALLSFPIWPGMSNRRLCGRAAPS
jgi:hypothetical protein